MVLKFVPDSWGPKVKTTLGSVTCTVTGPGRVDFSSGENYYSLLLITPQPHRRTSLASSRIAQFDAPRGTLEIIPADADYTAEWVTPKTNILVGIPKAKLTETVEGEFDRSFYGLYPPPVGSRDEIAQHLALLLQADLGPGGQFSELYTESLVNAYVIHLIRQYSSVQTSVKNTSSHSLSPHVWRRVNDFIHANLSKKISLEDLASVANLSASHFRRAFQKTIGLPPHQYLLKLRVDAVENLLLTTQLPLSMIADACGFSSQSHATTIVRKLRGVTPGEIRRSAGI